MSEKLSKDYNFIFKTFLKYLPSRACIIINSILILPFFAYILTSKEMATFQLLIVILDLICTYTTDWIAKSTLRFYEKYRIDDKLAEFYSYIITITGCMYILIIATYCTIGDFVSSHFFISKELLLVILFLIIPCGIRQFLYQLLRVFNRPFLYAFSIILYQLIHLCTFLILFNFFDNVKALLISMILAIIIIDIYIIRKISLNIKWKFILDHNLAKEIVKYGLPTVITSFSLWLIAHVNKFIFQQAGLFHLTAISGLAWAYCSYIFKPLFSTMLFSMFPIIINKFEHKVNTIDLTTRTIQLYNALFIPIISTFTIFSKEIVQTSFGIKYEEATILIPFFAISMFIHDLLKIFNIKYHMKNKMYIEMIVTSFISIFSILLNFKLISIYGLIGCGIATLLSTLLLFIIHRFINLENFKYILTAPIIKTSVKSIFICIALAPIIEILYNYSNINFQILKPIFFLVSYYIICWKFKHKILT